MPRERQCPYDRSFQRYREGEYESRSSSSDDLFINQRRVKKVRLGINAKPSSSIHEQFRYPHFSLGQVSGYIGLNVQFHNLTFDPFLAGELETIHTCMDPDERDGRIRLLHQIAQWNLRSSVSWAQLRNTYAHILHQIENHEISWSTDLERFERFIYDKVRPSTGGGKQEKKVVTRLKTEVTWFCKAYQCDNCSREAPHMGQIGNQFRQLQYICVMCWLKESMKRSHLETSNECPNKEN